MNSKYYGNSLDLFKYDLVTTLSRLDNYCLYYVGMVTKPQPKVIDPKYKIYEIGSLNTKLTSFLQEKFDNQRVNQIRSIINYFDNQKINYCSITEYIDESIQARESINLGYFDSQTRKEYFRYLVTKMKGDQRDKFIFIDPDIGSTIGISRRIRNNRSAYLKYEEIQMLLNTLEVDSYLGYFQHLGNTNYNLCDRLDDIKRGFGKYVIFTGYTRTQIGLVLIFRNEQHYLDKREKINEFILEYDHIEHKDKLFIL